MVAILFRFQMVKWSKPVTRSQYCGVKFTPLNIIFTGENQVNLEDKFRKVNIVTCLLN